MNLVRIQNTHVGNRTVAESIALALLAESGMAAINKDIAKSSWAGCRDAAVGIQTDAQSFEARVNGYDAFHGAIVAAIRHEEMRRIAHGLGLFKADNGKANEDGDTSIAAAAKRRADNYRTRITDAWKHGIAVGLDWSASKLAGEIKKAKAAKSQDALNAKIKDGSLLPHEAMQHNAGTLNSAVTAASLAQGSDGRPRIEAGLQKRLADMLGDVAAIVTMLGLGEVDSSLASEALDELASEVHNTREVLDGFRNVSEAETLEEIPAEEETESETIVEAVSA